MNHPLIVVLGPTASGKSTLAIQLAEEFSGEIVGCDSVQVYKYLNLGSSKVLPSQQLGVPHHLIDLVEPDQLFTAGEYSNVGRKILAQIRERMGIPFVVGGTGLYLRALLDGLFEGPSRSEELRQKLSSLAQREGVAHLHRLLARVDSVSAGRISANDKPKIIRALEVYFLTSRPLSWHFQSGRDPLYGFAILKLGLNPPRKLLYEFVDRRVDQMFAEGLVDEVRSILSSGFAWNLKPLQSLGYAQVIQYLQGCISLEEAVCLTKRDTRRYAKRQLTWFQKEKGVVWFDRLGSDPLLHSAVRARISIFLQRVRADSSSIGDKIYGETTSKHPGRVS